MTDNTTLLSESRCGDPAATEQLAQTLRDELRKLAVAHLKHERVDHTLQPTALVNEAYLRLIDQSRVSWKDTSHFLGIASQLMRRILVDHARAKGSRKRGGDFHRVFLSDTPLRSQSPLDLLSINDLIETLAEAHARPARVVDMHIFGGLKLVEIAEALTISVATVKNDWRFAKAWLSSHLLEEE